MYDKQAKVLVVYGLNIENVISFTQQWFDAGVRPLLIETSYGTHDVTYQPGLAFVSFPFGDKIGVYGDNAVLTPKGFVFKVEG